jgi:hypothetical protein
MEDLKERLFRLELEYARKCEPGAYMTEWIEEAYLNAIKELKQQISES